MSVKPGLLRIPLVGLLAFSVCLTTPAAAQRNALELYQSAKLTEPKAPNDCTGTVSDYLDGMRFIYAFQKVAEFNGTFETNRKLRGDVESAQTKLFNAARRCLAVEKPAGGQLRDASPTTYTPPPPPRFLPDPPPDLVTTTTHTDAEVEQWRQRALQAEASLETANRRVAQVSGELGTLYARVRTLVGTWEMALGPQNALISFTSTGSAWGCAEVDETTAKVTDVPCTVRLDTDSTRISLPLPDRSATLNLAVRFNGPDQLAGVSTITTPSGVTTNALTTVTLTRKR